MSSTGELTTTHQDRFGFLSYKRPINFEGGSLVPLPTFTEAAAWIETYKHKDGFVYPPVVTKQRGSLLPGKPGHSGDDFHWEDEPHTERPALLHHLPASHELALDKPPIAGDLRANDGAFLMHLAAYLFGVRLQFFDWWFDGRVPVRSTHNISPTPASVTNFFSQGLSAWRRWPERARRHFTNVLYMNSREPSYEWDWERFAINYMVFDAIYSVAQDLKGIRSRGHRERLDTMCKAFGLPVESQHLDEIYSLRNELFHEALWDGSQPCTSMGPSAYRQVGNLRRLNQRLIPALLDYQTEYIGTSWSCIDTFGFE